MKKLLFVAVAALLSSPLFAAVRTVAEFDFDKIAPGQTLPPGWIAYVTGPDAEAKKNGGELAAVEEEGKKFLRILDRSDLCEYGVACQFDTAPGKYYRAGITYRCGDDWAAGALVLSGRFLPGNTYRNTYPNTSGVSVLTLNDIPAGTDRIRVTLFTHKPRTTELFLASFKIEESDEPFAAPPPPKTAAAVRAEKLGKAKIVARDLCLDTALVRDGRAAAAIVIPETPAYRALAAKVNAAVKAKTGVELPLVRDESLRRLRQLDRHYLMLGNRDRNLAVSNLYNLHYTLLDAKYPGPGGSELRSLHNPFGDKHNIIFAGGSLPADDDAAVKKLIAAIEARPAGPELSLGFLADVTLSPEYEGKIARDVKDILLYERSAGYGDKAYFGWNSLSKNLAMLYMTNDKYYADEFLRLAFPKDEATCRELRERDDESYKDEIADPIKSVYHYRGIMMVLYWAMVEANPHFSDADREKVNQAFYRQLVYMLTKDDYTNPYRKYDKPGDYPIDRHTTWEIVGGYATARFLNAHYPCFDAQELLRMTENAMAGPLARFLGGTISRFWHQTQLEPLFFYAAIGGGLEYVGNPVLRQYGESLLLMSDLGKSDSYNADRMHLFSTPFLLNQFGYFCQDDAFTELYRRLPGPKDAFRIGQSFYPAAPYGRNSLAATAGKWAMFRMHPAGLPVKPPFAPEKVIQAMSFREKADGSGDYLLLDTRYAPGLRETPHAFSILNYLHQGVPVLRGHGNTMRFYADGMNIAEFCYYAEITAYGRVGDFAYVTAKMDRVDDFAWERTLILKPDGYLLIADDISPRRDMRNGEIYNNFLILRDRAAWKTGAATGELGIQVGKEYGAHDFLLSMSLPAELEFEEMGWDTQFSGPQMARFGLDRANLKKGERIRFATLVRPGLPGDRPATAQRGDEIALRLPAPALLTLGDEALTLTAAAGRLVRRGDDWSLEATPAGTEVEAKVTALLAARPAVAAAEREAVEAPKAVWRQELGAPVRQLTLFADGGRSCSAVSTGKLLTVSDAAGRTLWTREFADNIGAVAYQASKRRLLIGCKDEKLIALDLDGRPVWEFTSEMAPPMWTFGPYWHKSAVPGVRSVLASSFTGEERIYLGSTGTVEVLSADGKFLRRLYILYGPVELVEQPAADGRPARLLAIRSIGGWPHVHAIDADYQVRNLLMSNDTAGTDLGSFGFSSVGRMALIPVRFRSGGPLRLLGDLSGGHNRIGVWNLDGKILHDANLGPGLATSTPLNYGDSTKGTRFFKGLAAVDFAGDGTLDIAAVNQRCRLFIWDEQMKIKTIVKLPATAELMVGAPEANAVVIGLTDGRLYRVGGDGEPVLIGALPGRISSLAVTGRTAVAGDAGGCLAAFQI